MEITKNLNKSGLNFKSKTITISKNKNLSKQDTISDCIYSNFFLNNLF